MDKGSNRYSNFEALRILAIILILAMHCSTQIHNRELQDPNALLLIFLNAVGQIGVSCFVLISGYFGVKWKPYRFVQIILLTTFYSIICVLVNLQVGVKSLIMATLVIPTYKNWFISCYLLLMALSPYLNKLCDELSQKSYTRLLIILTVGLSIIPTFTNSTWETILSGGGKCLTYFLFLYMIGRYIRKFYDIEIKRFFLIVLFIFLTIFTALLNLILSYFSNKIQLNFSVDCSPFVLCSAIIVFYLFKGMSFKSRTTNYISSNVLAIYLLNGLRGPIDYHVFHISQHSDVSMIWLNLIGEVALTFTVAVFIENIRSLLLGKSEDKLIKLIISTYKQIKSNAILNIDKHLR